MNTQPNFIVIHTDQQRADCVSINGQRRGVYTPAIDSIGYRGANFTAAYTACPVCIPQRLSLLTGQDVYKRQVLIDQHAGVEQLGARLGPVGEGDVGQVLERPLGPVADRHLAGIARAAVIEQVIAPVRASYACLLYTSRCV